MAEHLLSLICTDSVAELIELLSAMSLGSLELSLFLSVDLNNFMIPTASESSFFLFPDNNISTVKDTQFGVHYFAYMKYKYSWSLSLQNGRCDANDVIGALNGVFRILSVQVRQQ